MRNDYSTLIGELKRGDRKPLHQLYLQYRQSFIEWATVRYQCSEADAQDIFQEVMIIFYENVLSGKIVSLRSHIRTYLFGIGKNLISQMYRSNKRSQVLEEEEWEAIPDMDQWMSDQDLESQDRVKVLSEAIQNLGATCKELLTLYYYHRFSMESIMNRLDYRNTDVAKSQKARCMKKLREQVQQVYQQDGI
ncbi:sigma-70 family RNA polymerase sigma factor [Pontibacter sp. G13]|uniref:RNA polymerase sigma factor n=1 Tax=Pontibacter sp. G13 TaxID=3074898 RepID=UPI00288A7C25|nr:sigma-70 family RNA polymerase sigma factor [Pontibacter sp. G13]WNJ21536.1 sigma-70 family RNA polymerase sigma factor [Pontibacter sp. G13]